MEMFSIEWNVRHDPKARNALRNAGCISPFCVVEFASIEEVRKVASRSVLLRNCCMLWAEAETYEELYGKLRSKVNSYERFIRWKEPFKFNVESFGKKLSMEYKQNRFKELAFLPVEGEVDLNFPTNQFFLFEHYGVDQGKPTDQPIKLYFGHLVDEGQSKLPWRYDLKTRIFIGNTSMDPFLSFLMANIAQISPGDLIYDPFVGTGSILLSCAHFGAYCAGAEIDYNVAHGREGLILPGRPSRSHMMRRLPEESVRRNFEQYNLLSRYAGIIVADSSVLTFHPKLRFDSIVTDRKVGVFKDSGLYLSCLLSAPYGLREKVTCIGEKKQRDKPIIHAGPHFPSKIKYDLVSILLDLLNFAATYLKIGGRLVYWFPVGLSNCKMSIYPQHPCLLQTSCCLQSLSGIHGRVLLTMIKVREPDFSQDKAYIHQDKHNFREIVLARKPKSAAC
ncbi:tRNA guanosine 2' O methyltransferase TRM11 [Trichuris trichiura]|uniref:tRNA guanosine 2' O methyltransferase TRM11 n=1 Tax=Trichuris trichiura TaxID=36087 RepID=A0A077ZB71_TRITR|nr:tRNA guanosine 2' O methyltransferase TRM11 [Trichuris trichiura]